MSVIDRRHWDGKGPINWLDRVESGPKPRGNTCCAVTTPPHGTPVECHLHVGHDGGHESANRFVWPPRDWEWTGPWGQLMPSGEWVEDHDF